MASNGFGFREVVIDQPFPGKWMDVDMYLGGGHSTFQGAKFSDFGGGFSYKPCSPPRSIVQNRCIYWRTLNDTLELTEISMDHNLFDNQVRYIFQNSPIVGPITIHETDTNIVILVATVTSIHKFVFIHPKRMPELSVEKSPMGNNKPSIFYQICNKPQMSFRSFNLFENAINIPVPLSASCHFVQTSLYPSAQTHGSVMVPQQQTSCNGESFFSFSYENGSVQVIKISKDDTLTTFDLNQSNILVRFFSGFTPSILRGSGASVEAVIGMSFFTAKFERGSKSLFLVTLGMNGHLRLWAGSNLQGSMQWASVHSEFVHRDVSDGLLTESSMLLKRSSETAVDELPLFVVYVPRNGFRVYNIAKGMGQNFGASTAVPPVAQLVLQEARRIDFQDRELIDFTVTADYIHILVSDPEEEIEWKVKSFNMKEILTPRFNQAVLEPLPLSEVQMCDDDSIDPKEFYMDLVFNKCSFNKNTIIQALTMFKKDDEDLTHEQDWNSLKIIAMNIVDREIAIANSTTDFELSDDDYKELCLKYWSTFYTSCVEYHIHTIKPLGLFYETNTRMLCVVKKSRISFLRPTDSLETLFYFPYCVPVADNVDGGDDRMIQLKMMLTYFEILGVIESTMEDGHRQKLDRHLRSSHAALESICEDLANLLTDSDPRSLHLQQRHFISLIAAKLKEIGGFGDQAVKHVLSLLLTWEREGTFLDPCVGAAEGVEDMDTGGPMVTEFFMGSRLGAHLSYKILTQLLQHRYMIARNTVILQSLCIRFFSQNNEEEGIFMLSTYDERREALAATTYYYALLQLSDEYFEYCRPMTKDKGIKVANSLKAFTADHLKNECFVDIKWPMRLLESFCISNLGGLSIRSRVSRSKKCGILAFAEAAGRSILPNDPTTKDHPLEEFLIATCQYSLLLKYAQFMTTYFPGAKGTLRKFYLGLGHLCLHNFETALNQFRSISFRETCDDIYFCIKYLEFSGVENPSPELLQELYSGYFLRIIKLFEIYDQIPSVQKLAEDGLRCAQDDDIATRMCSLAFKSAIKLDDYKSAYKYIMQIPYSAEDEIKERKEKLACLRIFISRIVERGDVETLMTLEYGDMFNKITTVGEQVEEILWSQANLSDPLQKDGVYQILYFYHISQQNFHKAASAMYFRVIQLGERGRGLEGLIAQRDSLLDVLTCLALVEIKDYRYVIRKTGVVPVMPETTKCLDGKEIPPLIHEQTTLEIRNYDEVHKELVLCIALMKIAPWTNPSPVKSTDFDSRVQQAIDVLTQLHFYDDALNLAKAWDRPVDDIIMAFTSSCVFLQKGILPQSGDPYDYIRHVDTSDLPNSNTDVIELAFRILQSYLSNFVKSKESGLYEKVTLKLLSCDIQLPQWLIDEYKRRNVAQFLRCYMLYGLWEEAADLTFKMIDAILGRRPVDEFDSSIKNISSYDPVEAVLPFVDVNNLGTELKIRGRSNKHLQNLYAVLMERVNLFCERVETCTLERDRLFQ